MKTVRTIKGNFVGTYFNAEIKKVINPIFGIPGFEMLFTYNRNGSVIQTFDPKYFLIEEL